MPHLFACPIIPVLILSESREKRQEDTHMISVTEQALKRLKDTYKDQRPSAFRIFLRYA
jgi:hypothetical protein